MSFSNYQQTVIINGISLSGVQDVNGSYGINEKPVRVAGAGFVDALIDSPLEGNFSISRKMVSRDPLLSSNVIGSYDFDEEEISGAILYDEASKGFGFTKGRVSRYSVSCSVGDIPSIETDIIVFGSLGKNVLSETRFEINESFANYPFGGDDVYFLDSNGNLLDGSNSENLKTKWDGGSLVVSQSDYNSLPSNSRIFDDGDVLGLGRNAFSSQVSYEGAINKEHPPIQFCDQSSIKVSVSDFEIDAVSDFSFSRTINLSPIYAIHQGNDQEWDEGKLSFPNLEPVQIDTQYPIETDINFTMIVQSYQIREIRERIQSAPKSDVSIQIRDSKTDQIINSLVGRNVRLTSESLTSNTEQEMSISLTYKGYETSHNPVI
jgi:hypothetical protein